MTGVSEPENVAREFDDRVLESTSSANERNATLAGIAQGIRCSSHAAVRTGRCNP